jgi:hypothetical protein
VRQNVEGGLGRAYFGTTFESPPWATRACVVHHVHGEAMHARAWIWLVENAGLLTAVGRWIDVTGYSSGSMQVRILSRR